MEKSTQQPVAWISERGLPEFVAGAPKLPKGTQLYPAAPVPRDVLMAALGDCRAECAKHYLSNADDPQINLAAIADRYASKVQPEPSGGMPQVDMGFGKFAVGGCQHPETKVPGIVYLHLRDDVRPLGADTSDVYPEGSQAQPKDIAGLIYFHNAFSIQQTIDVLLDMQSQYYQRAANQPEPVNQQMLAAIKRVTEEVQDLMSESEGVAGFHRNGDIATWSDLESGGRFERLSSLPDALAAIAAAEVAQPVGQHMRDPISIANAVVHEWNEGVVDYDEWGNDACQAIFALSDQIAKLLAQVAQQPASAQPVAVPEGYVLVPVEPTQEMIQAWRGTWEHAQYYESRREGVRSCYRAMLSAAQKPEGE